MALPLLPIALRVGFKLGKKALDLGLKAYSASYYADIAKDVSKGDTESLESAAKWQAAFAGLGRIKPITSKLQRVLVGDRKTGGLKAGEVPVGKKTYVFADNLQKTGKGGQAAIRGQIGAVGIPSKVAPKTYMSDVHYERNIASIDSAIKAIPRDKPIVISSGGIGTGLAKLELKAPRTYAYLQSALKKAGLHPEKLGKNVTAVNKLPTKTTAFNSKMLKSQIRQVSNQAKKDIQKAIKEGDPNITIRHSGSHASNFMANIYRKAVLRHNKTSSNKLNYQEQNLNIKVEQRNIDADSLAFLQNYKKEDWLKHGTVTGKTYAVGTISGMERIAMDITKHKSKDISYQDFAKKFPKEFKYELGITRTALPKTITIPSYVKINQGKFKPGKDVKLDLSKVKTAYQPRIDLGGGKYTVYDPGSIKKGIKGGTKTLGVGVKLSTKYSPMFQGTDVKSMIRMAGDKELLKQMGRTQRTLKSGKPESLGIVTMQHPDVRQESKKLAQAGWYKKKYDKWMRHKSDIHTPTTTHYSSGERMTAAEMKIAIQSKPQTGHRGYDLPTYITEGSAYFKGQKFSIKDGFVIQEGTIHTASMPPSASAKLFAKWLNEKNKRNPLFKGTISINSKTGKPIIKKTTIKTKVDPRLISRKTPEDPTKTGYGRHPKKTSFDFKTKKIEEPHIDIELSKSKSLVDPSKTTKFKKKPKKT